MFYLISENELTGIEVSLKTADISTGIIKEIRTPERIPLITWSGEDVIEYIKKHANCSKSMVGEIIRDVKKALENCDCALCFHEAVEYILKERGYRNE